MVSRRNLLKGICSSAILGPIAAATAGCGDGQPDFTFTPFGNNPGSRRPNILLMMCDQLRTISSAYPTNTGEIPELREVMSFAKTLTPGNPYADLLRGFARLRKNAVVARTHYIAAAACSPSRTSIMTGQYPSLHGVTQVNGTFKEANEIQFLDPNGVPTIGDWFEAAGYEAYYMGKWHVSDPPPPYDLTPWGFRGYESSGPEPHGSDPDNLGTFRDPGFGDIVTNFLNERDPNSDQPWFAVASFVNPHDIVAYPLPFFRPELLQNGEFVTAGTPPITNPQPIPAENQQSEPNSDGLVLDLNPDDFPQETFNLPPNLEEDLSTKPECHFDYSFKMQLALEALFPQIIGLSLPFPFQLDSQFQDWVRRYGQFYVYLQYLADLEIRRVLDTLDAKGLTDNTIVVFTSDHGEYLCSHGTMIEKWHAAYEEVTHVAMVVSSPLVNQDPDNIIEVTTPTSHIDLVPTLLGLAGIRGADLDKAAEVIRDRGHTQVRELPGTDLTGVILGRETLDRPGVLFTTDDRITELPDGVANPAKQAQFDVYLNKVDNLINIRNVPIVPGSVRQPNSVRSFADGVWKFNRYLDPNGQEPDQWEMYHLPSDPLENTNLVDFRTSALRNGVTVPGISTADLEAKRVQLKADLAAQESQMQLTPI